MITQEELKQHLHYDPETGDFTWISTRKSKPYLIGQPAGANARSDSPRIVIRVLNKSYQAHRLAWLYMTGEHPSDTIDHIDGNGLNNKWSNLRAATKYENATNLGLKCTNTSGYPGVTWAKKNKNWMAMISIKRHATYLGAFTDIEEAYLVYAIAKEFFHPFNQHAIRIPQDIHRQQELTSE